MNNIFGIKWFIIAIMALSLIGCGSDSNNTGTQQALVGVFQDSAVSGLDFFTVSRSGITNDNGEFSYLPGEIITFSIGGIALGSAAGAKVLTPLDLVSASSSQIPVNIDHPQVVNTIRLLQTIDADSNPVNGIEINSLVRNVATGTVIDLTSDLSVQDLENDSVLLQFLNDSTGQAQLIETEAAQQHFIRTLSQINGNNLHRIGGTVIGLDGILKLNNNIDDEVSISSSGVFSFDVSLIAGANYNVGITTQPTGQTCTIQNGDGKVAESDINSIVISCVDNTQIDPNQIFNGTVSGLVGILILRSNNGVNLHVTGDGASNPFEFVLPATNVDSFPIVIDTQPNNQICSFVNQSIVTSDNSQGVQIRCNFSETEFSISGTVRGLDNGTVAQNLVLLNNGGDPTTITTNGRFQFDAPVSVLAGYNVTIQNQRTGQTCSVTNGFASTVTSEINTVEIICGDAYTIGGSVIGLVGVLEIENNSVDDLTISSDGVFEFKELVIEGGDYDIAIINSPDNQSCSIKNVSGLNVTANITNIEISCGNRLLINDLVYKECQETFCNPGGFKNCVDTYSAKQSPVLRFVDEVEFLDCSEGFDIKDPQDYIQFPELIGIDLGNNPLSDIGDNESNFISGFSELEYFNLYPNRLFPTISIGIIISGLTDDNIDLFLNQLLLIERAGVVIDGELKEENITPPNWRLPDFSDGRDATDDFFEIVNGQVIIRRTVVWGGVYTLKLVNSSTSTTCSFIKTGGNTYEFGHFFNSTQNADFDTPDHVVDDVRIQCFSDGVSDVLTPIAEVNYLECSTPLPNENDESCNSGKFKACVEENAASKGWTNIYEVSFLDCRNKGIDDPRDADQFPNLTGIDLGGGTIESPGNPLRQMQSSFFSLPGMEFISVAPNSRTSPIAIDYIINGLKAENEAAFADAIRIVADNTFDLTNTLSVSVENADGNAHVIVNGGMWGYFIRAEVPATVGDQRCFFNTNGFTSVDLGRVLDDNPSDVKEINVECVNAAFTALPNEPILDDSSVVSTINVTDTGAATVTDVTNDLALKIDVEIEHTFSGDLTIQLRSPSGTNIQLWNKTGGSERNIIGTFSAAIFSATLDSDESLSGLNGEPVDGIWTLTVTDSGAGDTGSLISWGIRL